MLRDQLAAWEMAGMAVPQEYKTLHKQAHALFAEASSQQHNAAEASETAWKSLEVAFTGLAGSFRILHRAAAGGSPEALAPVAGVLGLQPRPHGFG